MQTEVDSGSEEDENVGNRTWHHNDILMLIHLMQKHEKTFETSLKKTVWQKITKILNETSKKKYTPLNVENKWKSLKRTYKSLKIKATRTGTQRKYWEYFQAMDDLMAKKPEINPPVVASSSSGIRSQQKKEDNAGLSSVETEPNTLYDDSDTSTEPSTSHDANNTSKRTDRFFRKRNALNVNDRHEAKLKRQDKFLELFEKLIDKM